MCLSQKDVWTGHSIAPTQPKDSQATRISQPACSINQCQDGKHRRCKILTRDVSVGKIQFRLSFH